MSSFLLLDGLYPEALRYCIITIFLVMRFPLSVTMV
jgi:hypothetical protein